MPLFMYEEYTTNDDVQRGKNLLLEFFWFLRVTRTCMRPVNNNTKNNNEAFMRSIQIAVNKLLFFVCEFFNIFSTLNAKRNSEERSL